MWSSDKAFLPQLPGLLRDALRHPFEDPRNRGWETMKGTIGDVCSNDAVFKRLFSRRTVAGWQNKREYGKPVPES